MRCYQTAASGGRGPASPSRPRPSERLGLGQSIARKSQSFLLDPRGSPAETSIPLSCVLLKPGVALRPEAELSMPMLTCKVVARVE